jgi:hypothetical protein
VERKADLARLSFGDSRAAQYEGVVRERPALTGDET